MSQDDDHEEIVINQTDSEEDYDDHLLPRDMDMMDQSQLDHSFLMFCGRVYSS